MQSKYWFKFILSMLFLPLCLLGQDKTAIDLWKELKVGPGDIQDLVTNQNCEAHPGNYLGCVAVVHQLGALQKVPVFLSQNYQLEKATGLGKEKYEKQMASWKAKLEQEGVKKTVFDFDTFVKSAILSFEEDSVQKIIETLNEYMVWAFDGHARLTPSKVYEQETSAERKEYVGLGIEVVLQKSQKVVLNVLPNGPSYGHLKHGDIIHGMKKKGDTAYAEIGKWSLQKMTQYVRVEKKKSEQEREIRLLVERDGKLLDEIIIVRKHFETKNVESRREGEYGYIKLRSFNLHSAIHVKKALLEFENENKSQGRVKGIILDLRNNPGGRVATAREIAEYFLGKKKTVVQFKGIGRLKADDYKEVTGKSNSIMSRINIYKTDLPLVILVNEGSASASEVLSGALRDHKRAILIGSRTYGKGIGQNPYTLKFIRDVFGEKNFHSIPFSKRAKEEGRKSPLFNSIEVSVTTSEIYHVKGSRHQGVGLLPHFIRYRSPKGISSVEKNFVREKKAYQNVPQGEGEIFHPEVSIELKSCVDSHRGAENKFNHSSASHHVDYQLESAVEVLDCLQR